MNPVLPFLVFCWRKEPENNLCAPGENCLGWHACRTKFARKIFVRATGKISQEKCSEIFPDFSAFPLWVQKKILQNSGQISCKISLQKARKIHHRASAGAQGEELFFAEGSGGDRRKTLVVDALFSLSLVFLCLPRQNPDYPYPHN